MRDRDALWKHAHKTAADRRAHASESDIQVGDMVFMQRGRRMHELASTYHPQPMRVLSRQGADVVCWDEEGQRTVRRNVSVFRPAVCMSDVDLDQEGDDDQIVGDHGTAEGIVQVTQLLHMQVQHQR